MAQNVHRHHNNNISFFDEDKDENPMILPLGICVFFDLRQIFLHSGEGSKCQDVDGRTSKWGKGPRIGQDGSVCCTAYCQEGLWLRMSGKEKEHLLSPCCLCGRAGRSAAGEKEVRANPHAARFTLYVVAPVAAALSHPHPLRGKAEKRAETGKLSPACGAAAGSAAYGRRMLS